MENIVVFTIDEEAIFDSALATLQLSTSTTP